MVQRLSIAACLAVSALALGAQDPAPAPAPKANPATPLAPAVANDSPEEAEWKAALELKKLANSANDSERGLAAAQAFTAFLAAHPASAHAAESLVEAGVCTMIAGRALQKWHRNTPEGVVHFQRALELFARVPKEYPKDPVVGRAWYCTALVAIQLDDLDRALIGLSTVIDSFASNREYFGKALERRAAVWRHRLEPARATADLERYVKEFPSQGGSAQPTDELKAVQRFSGYLRMFGKPAPALGAEVWAGGDAQSLAQLKGEVVALYFFAQWCHNCENEAGFIHEMNERWGPLGVHFIGVTDFSAAPQGDPAGPNPADPAETQKALDVVKAYLARHEFTFPVMMDRGAMARTYQARKYPEIVLVDREGRIAWHDHPATLLDSTLERILFGAPDAKHGGANAPADPASTSAPAQGPK